MKQRRLTRIVIDKRPNPTAPTAPGRFNSHHIRPGIGQQLPRNLAKVANFKHAQAFERAWERVARAGIQIRHQIASSATMSANSSAE